jgi:hypothetical protein
MELSKVSSIFFGQLFHENHLLFEAFEIVTITNGYLIFIFFQKIELTIPKF